LASLPLILSLYKRKPPNNEISKKQMDMYDLFPNGPNFKYLFKLNLNE